MNRYTDEERKAILDRNDMPKKGTKEYTKMQEDGLKENGRGWWITHGIGFRKTMGEAWIKKFVKGEKE